MRARKIGSVIANCGIVVLFSSRCVQIEAFIRRDMEFVLKQDGDCLQNPERYSRTVQLLLSDKNLAASQIFPPSPAPQRGSVPESKTIGDTIVICR